MLAAAAPLIADETIQTELKLVSIEKDHTCFFRGRSWLS